MKTPPTSKATRVRPDVQPAPAPAAESSLDPRDEAASEPAAMPEVLAGPVISPTPGRILWYYNYDHPGPLGAFVAFAHSDRLVNLSVCDASGHWHPRQNVILAQPGETPPAGEYCAWMPFQVSQARRYETENR